MKRDLRFEAFYPHPPERVWRAISSREAMARWLMENDFEPRVGHKFTFRTDPAPGFDGIVHCEVLEVDPPRRLRLSWHGGWQKGLTVVTFSLEPAPGGTQLVLEHNGFDGPRGIALSYILGSGWGRMIRKGLPEVLKDMAREEAPTQ